MLKAGVQYVYSSDSVACCVLRIPYRVCLLPFLLYVIRDTRFVLRLTLYVQCYARHTNHTLRCAGGRSRAGRATTTAHAEGALAAGLPGRPAWRAPEPR